MSHGHAASGARGKAKEVIDAHIAAVTRDYIVQPRLGTNWLDSTLLLHDTGCKPRWTSDNGRMLLYTRMNDTYFASLETEM